MPEEIPMVAYAQQLEGPYRILKRSEGTRTPEARN